MTSTSNIIIVVLMHIYLSFTLWHNSVTASTAVPENSKAQQSSFSSPGDSTTSSQSLVLWLSSATTAAVSRSNDMLSFFLLFRGPDPLDYLDTFSFWQYFFQNLTAFHFFVGAGQTDEACPPPFPASCFLSLTHSPPLPSSLLHSLVNERDSLWVNCLKQMGWWTQQKNYMTG